MKTIEVEGPKWVDSTMKGAVDKIDKWTEGNTTVVSLFVLQKWVKRVEWPSGTAIVWHEESAGFEFP